MPATIECYGENHDSRPAVIILHYGRPAATRRLHRQLLASDPSWKELIMVLDNQAPEPYPDAWQRLDENLFWGGALDYALHVCRDRGWPRLWFFNNDAFFISSPPHLEKAWQRLRKIERTIGPAGIYSPSFEHHPYHPQMVASPNHAYRRASCVDGVAPLINLKCWQALGGLDLGDNSRGYGLDLCFSLRASRAGWPVIVDHHVRMRHIYHSTAGSIPGFLAAAAEQERRYLEARLGLGYGDILRQAQTDFHDEVRL